MADVITSGRPASELVPHGLGWRAVLESRTVRVTMTKLRRGSSGLTAYVEVEWANGEKVNGRHKTLTLAGERVNISSGRERKSFATRLSERVPSDTVNWMNVLDGVCIEVHRKDDEGEPVKMIGNLPPNPNGGWLVQDFLERNQSHTVYGDGSVGKSWVALALAVSVASGVEILPGYRPLHVGTPLYIDYETDWETLNARVKQIARGVGIAPPTIPYLRLDQPFADALERVLQLNQEHKVVLNIVDSVEAAMAGSSDPGGPSNEGPARMNQALRRLGTTSLLIDHINAMQAASKDLAGRAYGSIFKRNWVRLSYELKRVTDSSTGNSSENHLGMFNTKRNNGPLFEPVGLRWSINDEWTTWTREAIEVEGFSEALPAWQRIRNVLRDEGPKTVADIVETTGLSRGTVSSALTKRGDTFERLPGGNWKVLESAPKHPEDEQDELPWRE